MNGGEIDEDHAGAYSQESFALREFLARCPPDYAYLLPCPASIDASPIERAWHPTPLSPGLQTGSPALPHGRGFCLTVRERCL